MKCYLTYVTVWHESFNHVNTTLSSKTNKRTNSPVNINVYCLMLLMLLMVRPKFCTHNFGQQDIQPNRTFLSFA